MLDQSLGEQSLWLGRAVPGAWKHSGSMFRFVIFGICIVREKPGSWVMPRGRFAELNSEVGGAVFRRLRRSRTKGVGHREEGDEADAVKRTTD
jgi:hypothetical protein